MISSKHPFWLVGFRPFFSLACLAGLSLPILWILVLKGVLPAPNAAFSPTQWHAHEMFYGFGWAVLGGFLLTSTKNWVNVRGYHGGVLIYLTAAWLVERLVIAFGGHLPAVLFWLGSQLFLISIVALLLATLIRHRHTDGYRRDNLFFLLILPTFGLAKILILLPDSFHLGWTMTLGLFRVAFLVMLERTLTQFMKSIFKVDILRHPLLDNSIKVLGILLVAAAFVPPAIAAAFSLLLATLSAWVLYQRPRTDPATRLWHKALRHLARRQVHCAPWETPLALAQRVRDERPELAEAFERVVAAYVQARYGPQNNDLNILRQAVAQLP